MRELTPEEMKLIAGGIHIVSQPPIVRLFDIFVNILERLPQIHHVQVG